MGSEAGKNPRILGATNKQLDDRLKPIEADVAALVAGMQELASRVVALEAGGSVDVSALDARLTVLENKTCPQQSYLDQLEARLQVLELDHIPD